MALRECIPPSRTNCPRKKPHLNSLDPDVYLDLPHTAHTCKYKPLKRGCFLNANTKTQTLKKGKNNYCKYVDELLLYTLHFRRDKISITLRSSKVEMTNDPCVNLYHITANLPHQSNLLSEDNSWISSWVRTSCSCVNKRRRGHVIRYLLSLSIQISPRKSEARSWARVSLPCQTASAPRCCSWSRTWHACVWKYTAVQWAVSVLLHFTSFLTLMKHWLINQAGERLTTLLLWAPSHSHSHTH